MRLLNVSDIGYSMGMKCEDDYVCTNCLIDHVGLSSAGFVQEGYQ